MMLWADSAGVDGRHPFEVSPNVGKLCDYAPCAWPVVTYRPVGTLVLDVRSTGGFPDKGESRPWGAHPAAAKRKVKS